jgi:tetratricopeptide (TPR) repeat protein
LPLTRDHQAAREILAGLGPDERFALLHLASCRRCRREVERELLESVRDQLGPPRRPPEPQEPRASPRPHYSEGFVEGVLTRTSAAAENARRLASLPAGDRRAAIAADAELRDPRVAAALLMTAEDALDDPAHAVQLAQTAADILSPLPADPAGRNLARLLRAFSLVVRGLRQQGRLEQAEDAYRRALPFLGPAPAAHTDGTERAALLAAVAQLHWTERRLDEAAALFSHAGRLFAELGERQGEAACRAQAAFVLLEQDDPFRARGELALAHAHVDAELAPALAARIALVLAYCNLAAGRLDQARQRLRGARGLYERALGAGEAVFRSWWEGLIAALEGERDRADSLLDSVRRRLLAEGSIAEAARASLDLLLLRVQSGRLDALSELAPTCSTASSAGPPRCVPPR